ncbi:hypothetical protein AH156_20035 [Salmonella enterica subsp. enterica serovar Enteritidis]|nr:hypothetical protein [Salmonella enterica subsp. enterica serovar Enteritidis]
MTETTEQPVAINTTDPFETILDVFLRRYNFPDFVPVDLTLHDGDFRGVMTCQDEAVDLETFVMLLRHKTEPDERYMVIHFNSQNIKSVPFIAPVTFNDDPDCGAGFIFNALHGIASSPDADAQRENPAVQTFFGLCLQYDEEKDDVSLTNFGVALSKLLTKALATPKPAEGEAIH